MFLLDVLLWGLLAELRSKQMSSLFIWWKSQSEEVLFGLILGWPSSLTPASGSRHRIGQLRSKNLGQFRERWRLLLVPLKGISFWNPETSRETSPKLIKFRSSKPLITVSSQKKWGNQKLSFFTEEPKKGTPPTPTLGPGDCEQPVPAPGFGRCTGGGVRQLGLGKSGALGMKTSSDVTGCMEIYTLIGEIQAFRRGCGATWPIFFFQVSAIFGRLWGGFFLEGHCSFDLQLFRGHD